MVKSKGLSFDQTVSGLDYDEFFLEKIFRTIFEAVQPVCALDGNNLKGSFGGRQY